MENWQTGGNLLELKHFEFPRGQGENMDAESTRAPEIYGRLSTGSLSNPSQATPRHPQRVTRRYWPDSAAIDDLVEALYQLLTDVPAIHSDAAESTCFGAASRVRNVF